MLRVDVSRLKPVVQKIKNSKTVQKKVAQNPVLNLPKVLANNVLPAEAKLNQKKQGVCDFCGISMDPCGAIP